MTVKVGSLFSGIGGMDLGLERAGMKVMWQVEKDLFCRTILEMRFPDARCYEDIKTFTPGDAAQVDIIAGGFPCQDISQLGGKHGLAGTRSSLWFEMLRVIRAARPRFILVENVPNLLKRDFGVILKGLADSGYDAQWQVLSAAGFGAPHLRKRVFVVAYPNGHGTPRWPERQGLKEYWQNGKEQLARFLQTGLRLDIPEIGFHGMDDGISRRMERSRAIGNSVVAQVAEGIGRALIKAF